MFFFNICYSEFLDFGYFGCSEKVRGVENLLKQMTRTPPFVFTLYLYCMSLCVGYFSPHHLFITVYHVQDVLPAGTVTLSSIASTENTFVCTYSRRLAIKTYKTYIMASSVSCVHINPVNSANSGDPNAVFFTQLSQDSQDSQVV